MTPVVTNEAATMIVTNTDSGNERDSYYYKDLMEKYKIDEQYAKTKSDKDKAQKLYQYSYKRYKQESNTEIIAVTVVLVIIIAIIIWVVAM